MAGSIFSCSLLVVDGSQSPGRCVRERVVWTTSRWPMSLEANSDVSPRSLAEHRRVRVLPQFSTVLRPGHVSARGQFLRQHHFLVRDIAAIRIVMDFARSLVGNALARSVGRRPCDTSALAPRDMPGAEKVNRHRASPFLVTQHRK